MIKQFKHIGWSSKVTIRRFTFNISINKLIALGCCLKKGQILYSYLAENKKRPVMITYLDGKPRK